MAKFAVHLASYSGGYAHRSNSARLGDADFTEFGVSDLVKKLGDLGGFT
jgi:hypothetical protein